MTDDVAIDVSVSEDRMAVLISCEFAPDQGYEPMVRSLEGMLNKLGLPQVNERSKLEQLLREIAAQGPKADKVTLFKGVQPVEGENGYVAWAQDFFNSAFCVDPETGNVDYRRRVAQTSVEEGQLLARIVPPKPGTPGMTVFGEPIAPADVEEADIRTGQNVEFRAEDESFYATINGRIRLDDNKVSVDDVLTIEESVGLRSGDIKHTGAVIVQKDVEAGATVEAEGDVEVHGVIDGATVIAGGNLIVHSGIIGRPETVVRVNGTVHARFITECNLEAEGDVTAERQIVNSIIKCRGQVYCPGAVVVGGDVCGLGGVVVNESGSAGCVRTVVRAGLDFKLHDQVAALEKEKKELTEKREAVEKTLAPFLPKVRAGEIPDRDRDRVIKLIQADKELRSQTAELTASIEALRTHSKERARFAIEVKHEIHPETVVVLGHERMHFSDQFRGPIAAKLVKGQIVLQ